MSIKKVGAICNADGRYYLMDQKDDAGEIMYQWLGSGGSAYPLMGLPVMGVENICALFDITNKKREKLVMRRSDVPGTMNWGDTDALERQLDDPKLCVRYNGDDLLPLETTVGVTFIQEKYLLPLDGLEYMRLYERKDTEGRLYIVVKIGLAVQAVIMPVNLPDQDFMDALNDLTCQCNSAMRIREIVSEKNDAGPLFQVDENTGEILD